MLFLRLCMNLSFTKIILILTMALLVPQNTTHAASYPLSDESKQHIALITLSAALISGTVGYFVHKINSEENYSSKKPFPWKAVLIPATIGAALAGLYAYFNCPEKVLEYAENELARLKNTYLFEPAINHPNASASELTKIYSQETYQTIAVVEELRNLQTAFHNVTQNLTTVSTSGIQHVSNQAKNHIRVIKEEYDTKLQGWLVSLNDAFKAELIVQTQVAAAKAEELYNLTRAQAVLETAHAKSKAANAQQTFANAAWLNALNSNQKQTTVIITTPAPVVRPKLPPFHLLRR